MKKVIRQDNIQLGLKQNWKQFVLLVIINAFVGGMVGMERTILPALAQTEFHIAAKTAIFSFIIAFGIAKAIANYFTGILADRIGRKNLLLIGWLLCIPVPLILIYAPSWNWIIAANVLLGTSQGLAWSATVVMKIDLVGVKQRGFAMGLNEFAGYISVAAVGFLTGWVASVYGLRPYPFYIGIGILVLGILSSWFLINDTRKHVAMESTISSVPILQNVFIDTAWKNKNLSAVTQAGLVNNLNDGMAWGVLPLLLASKGFSLKEIGIIAAVYPAVWGLGQIITGRVADRICKKDLMFWGMMLQALSLILLVMAVSFTHFIVLAAMLGWGTAMVYPTFLASIAENTHPNDRAKSLGVFRFWRDLGYALGAFLTGMIADRAGINASVIFTGGLTLVSALVVRYRMRCSDRDNKKLKDLIFEKISITKSIQKADRLSFCHE